METYRRASGVVGRRIAGEMVLVPINTRSSDASHRVADFYVLNPTAEVLYEMLGAPSTIEAMAQQLISLYAIPPEQAHSDVERFIADMLANHAVERAEDQ